MQVRRKRFSISSWFSLCPRPPRRQSPYWHLRQRRFGTGQQLADQVPAPAGLGHGAGQSVCGHAHAHAALHDGEKFSSFDGKLLEFCRLHGDSSCQQYKRNIPTRPPCLNIHPGRAAICINRAIPCQKQAGFSGLPERPKMTLLSAVMLFKHVYRNHPGSRQNPRIRSPRQ